MNSTYQQRGYVYLRVPNLSQSRAAALGCQLAAAGYKLCANDATAALLEAGGVPVSVIEDETLLGLLALHEIGFALVAEDEPLRLYARQPATVEQVLGMLGPGGAPALLLRALDDLVEVTNCFAK